MNCPSDIQRYIDKSPELRRWKSSGIKGQGIDTAVVIPALAESGDLFDTLLSLSDNGDDELSRTLVICVINNRSPSAIEGEIVRDNRTTIEALKGINSEAEPQINEPTIKEKARRLGRSSLRINYVDASSPGLELPCKKGVGLARKIGMDLALTQFDYSIFSTKLIVSLDADTLVEKNYLTNVRRHFESQRSEAACIGFNHRLPADLFRKEAIIHYEIYLRYYVLALHHAGSPYAFHTVGSTIAFTDAAYVAVGGMNRKAAGEDFYLLQKLAKQTGMRRIDETTVYPSARTSGRVPFGTGRTMMEMAGRGKTDLPFYHPAIFDKLRSFISLVSFHSDLMGLTGNGLIASGGDIDSAIGAYLEGRCFEDLWNKLKKNSKSSEDLLRRFHGWFDAFKTLKLVHFMRDESYGTVCMREAAGALKMWYGDLLDFDLKEDLNEVDEKLRFLDSLRRLEISLNWKGNLLSK